MFKSDVIDFFNQQASIWDKSLIKNDDIVNKILDNAGVTEGINVLDVACGTGVLLPDYLERKVESVVAVDISPDMIKIAKEKFPQENVEIICADIEEVNWEKKFDCIMVYNAFPHFPNPENLIKHLSGMLKNGGYLSIAHGQSRAQIDNHHKGHASKVSVGLMHEDKLEEIFGKYLSVTLKISNDQMYQVVGKKK